MSRAFLLEPTSLPTDKAEKFGQIVLMYDHVSMHPNPFSAEFQVRVVAKLKNLGFDHSEDYLILSGRMTALITMVAAVVAEWGSARALIWDARDDIRDYREVEMGPQSLEGAMT